MSKLTELRIRFWRFPLWRKSWTEIAYKFYPVVKIKERK
jgi:hypothetical protein